MMGRGNRPRHPPGAVLEHEIQKLTEKETKAGIGMKVTVAETKAMSNIPRHITGNRSGRGRETARGLRNREVEAAVVSTRSRIDAAEGIVRTRSQTSTAEMNAAIEDTAGSTPRMLMRKMPKSIPPGTKSQMRTGLDLCLQTPSHAVQVVVAVIEAAVKGATRIASVVIGTKTVTVTVTETETGMVNVNATGTEHRVSPATVHAVIAIMKSQTAIAIGTARTGTKIGTAEIVIETEIGTADTGAARRQMRSQHPSTKALACHQRAEAAAVVSVLTLKGLQQRSTPAAAAR